MSEDDADDPAPPDPAAPTDGTDAAGDGRVPDESFVEIDVGDVTGTPAAVEAEDAGREVAVVPKRTFCERCEYFADPPAVGCTHEGTEITEVVDTDHFRVVDCPVVARRRAIGDETVRSNDAE